MEAMIEELREELFRLRDGEYRDFQRKLIPTVEPEAFIGVRTPALRRFARELMRRGEADPFLDALPHRYFDENQLHAFILSEMKDYGRCLEEVDRFLPYIDNWATCDQLSPKVFARRRGELTAPIRAWIRSGQTYAVRFGIGMLMQHFLDEDFDPAYPEMVAELRSEEYYVNIMSTWLFAEALVKQWDDAVKYIETRRLDPWTHNMAIRKACESFRVPDERKEYLRTLRCVSKKG